MLNEKNTPHILLDSKIRKLRIELPNFKFNHSTSEESDFIGRMKISEKLKALIEDKKNETGVYLITGNRGVGKTSLVKDLINKTSFQFHDSKKKLKDKLKEKKKEIEKYIKNKKRSEKNKEKLDEKLAKKYNEHNRIYLRINFGHNLKDEKDILRLITSTLSTEYGKYRSTCPKFYLRTIGFYLLKLRGCFFHRYSMNGFATHRTIKQQLKKLNSDIVHSTERENSINIGGEYSYRGAKTGTGIGTRTKKSRGVADAREIEKELQNILENMQRIPEFICRPNIVIVFDELDKVESGKNDLEKETSTSKASMFSINATRERQTEILKILSNMKYFLSTAKAKFIFIAGREMYDMYLADVSERSNYIGSIFNAVIYVPSFLADFATNKSRSDMTSLTEEFVCRKLIPNDYWKKCNIKKENEEYNLKNYREYLEKVIYKKYMLKKAKERLQKIKKILEEDKSEKIKKCIKQIEDTIQEIENSIQEAEKKTQKIIAVLQQLIIYLAHVSKGAPKKMIQLFESFIEVSTKEQEDKNKEDNFLTVKVPNEFRKSNKPDHFFLTFDYFRQYALGITAYLITPVFNRLAETNIKEYSDKLLVSSLRFVDFLFKFHKHTFSWKNLEISPELLEVNRSPELKSVAIDLLNYFAQIHINKSSFSLNDYKFDSLIANEISAMTKTDEVFSALHSFSLDETLPMKEHYRELLKKVQEEHKDFSTKFNSAISSLQVTLGDLHYYDDELEEARMYYKNAIQTLLDMEPKKNKGNKNKDNKNKDNKSEDDETEDYETMNLEQLYVFVRNMLKLGMIYEKRKQYDFAYLTYGELCKRIIRERNIAIPELKAGIVARKDKNGRYVFVKASDAKSLELEAIKRKGLTKEKERKAYYKEERKYYDNIEVLSLKYYDKYLDEYFDEKIPESIATLQPLFFKYISPKTNDLLFKKMTLEGLKMLYLPFIAKLQMLEKSHVGGITRNHLEQLDREFTFLTSVIDHEETKILEADFFSRVADILYYKNLDLMCKNEKNREDDKSNSDKKNPTNHSCTACHYYYKALYLLLNEQKDKENKETLSDLLKKAKSSNLLGLLEESIKNIGEEGDYKNNMKYCTVLARILSNWGNVFYSCDKRKKNNYCCFKTKICDTPKDKLENEHFESLEKCIRYVELRKNGLDIKKGEDEKYTKMEIAFVMYSISLKAYTIANLFKRSAYQVYKMLRLFKSYEINEKDYITKAKNKEDWFNILGQKAIRSLWYATEELNVFELNKRKKDFFDEYTIEDKVPLRNLLVDCDISRIRILIKELELRTHKRLYKDDKSIDFNAKLKEYYSLFITSPYSINYSISARIYRLRLKSMVNFEAYQMLIEKIKEDIEGIIAYNSCKDWLCFNDKGKVNQIRSEINYILKNNDNGITIKEIFDFKEKKESQEVFELLVVESIFCLREIIRLSKTIGETHLFGHSFIGATHDKLAYWTRRYETYKKYYPDNKNIDNYLEYYLGEEWKEGLSGYYENQQALSHYYKSLEMHKEGKAYHSMIGKMCYIKDDYNDCSDHFNIASERYYAESEDFAKKLKGARECYQGSELYKVENYFKWK